MALACARFEAQVHVRSMLGISEVHRRSMAVSSLGSRLQLGWLGGRAVVLRHAARSRRGTECRGEESRERDVMVRIAFHRVAGGRESMAGP